jgi:hypothetical protein
MLTVQSYLHSGKTLADLESEYAISYRKAEGLVILNYSQIDSPKTEPIVRECRSLILEDGTWDLVSMAFYRFFNYGECGTVPEFDAQSSYALEKIDGSIFHYFVYRGRRMTATRSMIGAVGPTMVDGVSFDDVFWKAVARHPSFHEGIKPDWNYVFELVGPEVMLVTPYDYPDLYLLAARSVAFQKEADLATLDNLAGAIGVKLPRRYRFSSLKDVERMAVELPRAVDEGYVCVDYSWAEPHGSHYRVKVKNPRFVAIAHIRDKACSTRAMFELFMRGEEEELLSYFPYLGKYMDKIKEKAIPFIERAESEMRSAFEQFPPEKIRADKSLRAEFAKTAKNSCCSRYLFDCIETGPVGFKSYFDNQVKALMNGTKPIPQSAAVKSVSRSIMQVIGIAKCFMTEED